ncbi:unnamed protein product [Musa textilis]
MTMAWRFHQLVLSCVLAVAILRCSGPVEAGRRGGLLARTAPTAADQFLPGHNEARKAVLVGPLQWSANLSSSASVLVRHQKQNSGCEFADLESGTYGANQAWTSYPVSPEEAVRSWVGERKYYSYENNSCAAGHECGTYTQVVWRKTAEVGCAQATCGKGGATLTLSLYRPHGNVQGQKPY